jgi:ABC-type antimicrobial peptide transport system permease subunit
MIAFEAVFLGLLGVALGTAAGLALVMITAQTGIDFAYWGGRAAEDLAYQGLNLPLDVYPRPAAIDVFQGLAAILFTALVAAIWPASVAARLEPVKAMRA